MKSAWGFSTEGTLSFVGNVINSMGTRPSQKSLVRKKLLSKKNFQLILYFEPKGNEGQCVLC